jgi:flagellar basal-body rod protein FlgB
MADNGSFNTGLFDRTMSVLSRALDYRAKNHRVISSNLSNIDTPGYRPKTLPFEEELRRAATQEEASLRRTHPEHLPNRSGQAMAGTDPVPIEEGAPIGASGSLDIDAEMAKMSQNNILYETTIKMLSRKFDALRMVIEEQRR